MIIETLLYNQLQDLNNVENFENHTTDDVVVSHKNKSWCNPRLKVYLLIALKVILTTIAVYLAWDCNRKTKSKLFKYTIIVLAALFSDFYILFYFIYRILLNNSCDASQVLKTVSKVTKATKVPKVKIAKSKLASTVDKFTKAKIKIKK